MIWASSDSPGGPLGALLGRLGGLLDFLEVVVGRLGAILGRLGGMLGELRKLLEALCAVLGAILDRLGPSWKHS